MSGPYRASPPRIEAAKSWRWAAYAVCFLVGGIPAGVLARASAAAAYGWAAAPERCREGVEILRPGINDSVTCSGGGKLELTRNESGGQLVICRCSRAEP